MTALAALAIGRLVAGDHLAALLGRAPGSSAALASASRVAPGASGNRPEVRGGGAGQDEPAPSSKGEPGVGPGGVARGDDDPGREVRRLRLARAEETLRRYLESTRYPPNSRPLYEHADQADLPEPERTMPVDKDDPDGTRVRARQSSVFIAGDESVAFAVSCEKSDGAAAPCDVEAYAELAEHYGAGGGRLPVVFAPDDSRAHWTAVLTPSRDGFAGAEGTLRTWVRVRAADRERALFFDVLFTARPPAHLTGRVDERLEQGSLVLALELVVERPGRYVALGRVDDADRQPLALVSFNEELPAGTQSMPLVVFGKLVRDLTPPFPLLLRDVQVFRLREDGDPDRELLPTQAGPVHITRSYPLDVFSDAEWQSEERDRYIRELTGDVERAGGQGKGPPGQP